mgnify:CR=1 FL=1
MNINSKNIYIIYLFLYFSLLLGFYFNEDFGLGYRTDYSILRMYVPLFEKDFINGVKYDSLAYNTFYQLGDYHGMAISLSNLAQGFNGLNDYNNALITASKSVKLFENLNDYNELGKSYILLSIIYFQLFDLP